MAEGRETGTKSLECLIINYRPTQFEFWKFDKKRSEVTSTLSNFKGDFLMQKLFRWKFERRFRKQNKKKRRLKGT